MSVYLTLNTSQSPSITDIAEFGRIALALGVSKDNSLAIQFGDANKLTVVIPILEEWIDNE